MRRPTPPQSEIEYIQVKKAFCYLRDIAEVSLDVIGKHCNRHPGSILQYRSRTRITPPAIRLKLIELAKNHGYDPTKMIE